MNLPFLWCIANRDNLTVPKIWLILYFQLKINHTKHGRCLWRLKLENTKSYLLSRKLKVATFSICTNLYFCVWSMFLVVQADSRVNIFSTPFFNFIEHILYESQAEVRKIIYNLSFNTTSVIKLSFFVNVTTQIMKDILHMFNMLCAILNIPFFVYLLFE